MGPPPRCALVVADPVCMYTQRLDMMHHIYLLLLQGKLHQAPLENPQRVLDIGTGTGIWAIDFAE